MTAPDVMTADEAADYLRISVRTLIRMRLQRRGPAWTYAGAGVRYRKLDLDRYLADRVYEPVGEVG